MVLTERDGPLPASPTRGEVQSRGCGSIVPDAPAGTSPLVGGMGEGRLYRLWHVQLEPPHEH
jgi:hypothetical protein